MKGRRRIPFIIGAISVILLLVVMVGYLFLYACSTGKMAAGNNEAKHIGLYVDGTKLRSSDGSLVVMKGVNHAHCWYQEYDEEALDAIESWGANCVRIVCADGDQWQSDTPETIARIIDSVNSRNMISVLEVHDATGSDDVETLERAAKFWVSMADTLKGTEEYCIINIANEWCGSWDADLWSEGYKKAIELLREAGINNVIMVDAAGWGQYGRSIRKNGLEVFEADPQRNTMFSVHMYGMSGRYEWLIRYNLEGATEQNLCVCVGEFGYTHSDGDVKEDYLMKYCAENGIGTLAWSFKGNSGGVEYLDLSEDWSGKILTRDWGEIVVNGEYGLKYNNSANQKY